MAERTKHHWTPEEDEYIKQYYPTTEIEILVEHLGLRYYQVEKRVRVLKLHKLERKKRIDYSKSSQIHKFKHVMPERIKDKLGYYDNYNYQAISL
jgi:hypothetical protein